MRRANYVGAPTCEECFEVMIRTSELYLCCPNGHGKLVLDSIKKKRDPSYASVPAMLRKWGKWQDLWTKMYPFTEDVA